jgi:hypothetical protein
MMSNEQFEKLMDKLDALIKITAVNVSQGKTIAEVLFFFPILDSRTKKSQQFLEQRLTI